MLPDAVKTAFAGSTITVTKVTQVRTIADILNQSEMVKGMLSQVNKLLTFPVTSALLRGCSLHFVGSRPSSGAQ